MIFRGAEMIFRGAEGEGSRLFFILQHNNKGVEEPLETLPSCKGELDISAWQGGGN